MFPISKSYHITKRTVPYSAYPEYRGMRFRVSQRIYSISKMRTSFRK
jgi:hypothetical protein